MSLAPNWRSQPLAEFVDNLHTPDTSMVTGRTTRESIMESIPEVDRGGVPLCERAVIASIIEDGGKRKYCLALAPSDFANPALGKVFGLLMAIEGPVDLPIAVEEAKRHGLDRITGPTGLAVYLASLLDDVFDPENISAYVTRVKRAATARSVAAELEQMRIDRATRSAR